MQLASAPPTKSSTKASNANDWNDSISEEEWFAKQNTPEMRAADGMYASLDGGGSPNYAKENYIRMVNAARAEKGLEPLSRVYGGNGEAAFTNFLSNEDSVAAFNEDLAEKTKLQAQLEKQNFAADKWDDVVDFFGGNKSLEHKISSIDTRLNERAFGIAKYNALFVGDITGDYKLYNGFNDIETSNQAAVGKKLIDSFSGARKYADQVESFIKDVKSQSENISGYVEHMKTGAAAFGITSKFINSSLEFFGKAAKSFEKISSIALNPFKPLDLLSKAEKIYKNGSEVAGQFGRARSPEEMAAISPTIRAQLEIGDDSIAMQEAARLRAVKNVSDGFSTVGKKLDDYFMGLIPEPIKKHM